MPTDKAPRAWRSSAGDYYITYEAAIADIRKKKDPPTLTPYFECSEEPLVMYCQATSGFYQPGEAVPPSIQVLGLIGLAPAPGDA